ncbi:MAG: hypothetical protein JKY50_13415 [Oleispira sp.]|nr:hypothetical protein [Oleispira sp.]MBL4880408.1 hypothetical protein [Oleispira sp.]
MDFFSKTQSRFFLSALVALLLITGCKDGLIESNTEANNVDGNNSSSNDLKNGIIFLDDAMTFQLKPNEEQILFTLYENLLDRKTEEKLSSEQIDNIDFEITGANAQFFTLEKTTIATDNTDNLPSGKQWAVTFNKNYQYFYDEVQTQCLLGRCNATLMARTNSGNEAISRIEISLITQESFSLINGNSVSSGVFGGGLVVPPHRISDSVVALENQENTFYLPGYRLLQGKRIPSKVDIQADLQYDINGDGSVDINERFTAESELYDAFWRSAVLNNTQFRQTKYVISGENLNSNQAISDFSIGFEQANKWFDAIDNREILKRGNILIDAGFFRTEYQRIKNSQYDGLLAVIKYKAPVILNEERVEKTCTRTVGGSRISVPYYSKNAGKLTLTAIPTDETAPWLIFNIDITIVGSEFSDFVYINESNSACLGAFPPIEVLSENNQD